MQEYRISCRECKQIISISYDRAIGGDTKIVCTTCADQLQAERNKLKAENERLRDYLFSTGAMNNPPCFNCGYNGPGYFQPDKHPCAKKHHDLTDPLKAKAALREVDGE